MSRRPDHPFVIRAAIADDVPAIAAIYESHVAHGTASFELTPPGVDEMGRRLDAVVAGHCPYLVAVDASPRVLGFAYAAPYRSRPAYRHTVEDSVYVREGEGGRGVGSALLDALIEACESRGFRQMIAVIGGAENGASIALHASCGFVEVGRLHAVGRKFERWVDTVLMQRALGDGDASAPYQA